MKNLYRFRQCKIGILVLVCCCSESAYASHSSGSHYTFTKSEINIGLPVNWPITGKVTSSKGEPLPGVTVLVKGTTIGASTSADGTYTISVPEQGGTLVFSFIGFTTTEKGFSGPGAVNITMAEDAKALDEVVVVGYGTQKKSQVTGAISSVTSKEIQELPITSAQQALQGRSAGVEVTTNNGRPGEGATVRIRGRRSINASNDPLYVVDGIPLAGGINDINPNDIESMEILKDASSTAIYGSRGANGVVLITTKRGKAGATTVTYDGYYGPSKVIRQVDMMNGAEFAEYKRESRRAVGAYNDADPNADENTKGLFVPVELEGIKAGRSTNYQDLIFQTGHQQSHQVGVLAGTEKTKIAASAGYFDETGILPGQSYKRMTLRINLDQQINSRVKVGASTLVTRAIQNFGSNPLSGALEENPLGAPYDENGNIIFQPTNDGLRTNPLSDIVPGAIVDERRIMRLFSSIYGEVKIAEGLNYRVNFGPDMGSFRRGNFTGSLTNARRGGPPTGSTSNNQRLTYTLENIITHNKKFGTNHSLTTTLLQSIQKERFERSEFSVLGLPAQSSQFYDLGAATQVTGIDSDLRQNQISSFMARFNYAFKDKYMLTLTGRADGSSKFSEDHKWGFFPSAALAWRVIDENFMSGVSFMNDLKLRVSYGETGNTEIDPYQTFGRIAKTTYAYGNSAGFGYRPSGIANKSLTWESTASFNVGIDYAFFDSRIAGSIEGYQSTTSDLLLRRQLPITSGFDNVLENIGSTRNTGVELTLNTINVDMGGNGFRWSTDLNVFANREQILELYGGKQDDVGNRWFIGKPLTVFYDNQFEGIWQNEEKDLAASFGMKPGEIKVADINGDGKLNDADRIIIGSDIPKWAGGMTNRFSFKGFELSGFIFTRQGNKIMSRFHDNFNNLAGRYNNLDVDYWTPTNPSNSFPRPNQNQEFPKYRTAVTYFDGSFVKVRNIQLGYNFEQSLVNRLKMQSLRIYLSAQNPFMFTKYTGYDPEDDNGQVSSDVPRTKMLLLGVNVKF